MSTERLVLGLAALGAGYLLLKQREEEARRQYDAWIASRQGGGGGGSDPDLGDVLKAGLIDFGLGFLSDRLGSGSQGGFTAQPSGVFDLDEFLGAGFGFDGTGGAFFNDPGAGANTRADRSSWGPRLVVDLQRQFGFTRPQAAGVVGNLDHESDGFRALQEYTPLVPGSKGGWGIAQWTGPRRREFFAWAERNNLAPDSYAANLGFLVHEMTNTWEKRVVPRIKATRTAAESAKVFSETFLRPGIPHLSSRIQRAERYV